MPDLTGHTRADFWKYNTVGCWSENIGVLRNIHPTRSFKLINVDFYLQGVDFPNYLPNSIGSIYLHLAFKFQLLLSSDFIEMILKGVYLKRVYALDKR